MLTAAQCETVAYTTPWGEFFCSECTVGRLEQDGGPGVEGFEPIIAYSLDEYASEMNADLVDDRPEDCTNECEPFGLNCDSCGRELVEPYHYGHQEYSEDGIDDNVDHPVYPNDESIGRGTDADA
jgi:hypothetical protein